jgi:bifunctional DNase/RNase
MKCEWQTCGDEADSHIIEIRNRKIASQKSYCGTHCARQRPFCDPGGGVTTLGAGLTGGVNRFEMEFITYFDHFAADGVYLREISGSKVFSMAVARDDSSGLGQSLQERTYKPARPLVYGTFALVTQALGAMLEDVEIHDFQGDPPLFHARARFVQSNRHVVVEMRPGVAFALAIVCDAPIVVVDKVLARSAELRWTGEQIHHLR